MPSESANQRSTSEPVSEMDLAKWSVISFDRLEAKSLVHADAVIKMAELDGKRISGLCIITDEAAERMVKSES